jgi:hypothetical protein
VAGEQLDGGQVGGLPACGVLEQAAQLAGRGGGGVHRVPPLRVVVVSLEAGDDMPAGRGNRLTGAAPDEGQQ